MRQRYALLLAEIRNDSAIFGVARLRYNVCSMTDECQRRSRSDSQYAVKSELVELDYIFWIMTPNNSQHPNGWWCSVNSRKMWTIFWQFSRINWRQCLQCDLQVCSHISNPGGANSEYGYNKPFVLRKYLYRTWMERRNKISRLDNLWYLFCFFLCRRRRHTGCSAHVSFYLNGVCVMQSWRDLCSEICAH